MRQRTIAVIGAGAAGLFAAAAAARAGAAVTVYEHRKEAGRKLLMTGNGKCNLTNERMGAQYYHSHSQNGIRVIAGVLAQFDEKKTKERFEEFGLLTYARDGYVYPQSEQARDVRDVLVRECALCGVSIRYEIDVYPLLHKNDAGQFVIGEECYDGLIVACGGKSERQTGSDGSGFELAKRFGHTVHVPLPALVPLYTDRPDWKNMAGVRAKADVRLLIDGCEAGSEYGEVQITEQGISGIPVFQLSRHAVHAMHEGKSVEVELCFLHGRKKDEVQRMIFRMLERSKVFHEADANAEREYVIECLKSGLTGIVNNKILSFLLRELYEEQIVGKKEPLQEFTKKERLAGRMTDRLFSCRIPMIGHAKLDHAQVTGGGISFDEVTDQLESRLCPGLFFAGEMLDADGVCGGYNLQWAWSSGYVAAMSAAGVRQ